VFEEAIRELAKKENEMKRFIGIAMLMAGAAFAQNAPTADISVAYRLLNSETTPESMAESNLNLGVLVFVKTTNGAVGVFQVRLDYIGTDGLPHEVKKTIAREQTRGGFDPSAIPVLFKVSIMTVSAVYVEGFTTALDATLAPSHQ
jgi:hypothetical protein